MHLPVVQLMQMHMPAEVDLQVRARKQVQVRELEVTEEQNPPPCRTPMPEDTVADTAVVLAEPAVEPAVEVWAVDTEVA